MVGRAAGECGVGHAAAGGAAAEIARTARSRDRLHPPKSRPGDLRSEKGRRPHQDREEVRHDGMAVEAVQRTEGRPHPHRPGPAHSHTGGVAHADPAATAAAPEPKKESAGKGKKAKPVELPEPEPVDRSRRRIAAGTRQRAAAGVPRPGECFPGHDRRQGRRDVPRICEIYQRTHADAADPALLEGESRGRAEGSLHELRPARG